MFGEPDKDDPFSSKEKDKGAPEVTKLYGDWQTEEWIPPKAENGIVPKNDRGNVLCPPLAYCLPQVCHHCSLSSPGLSRAAAIEEVFGGIK